MPACNHVQIARSHLGPIDGSLEPLTLERLICDWTMVAKNW